MVGEEGYDSRGYAKIKRLIKGYAREKMLETSGLRHETTYSTIWRRTAEVAALAQKESLDSFIDLVQKGTLRTLLPIIERLKLHLYCYMIFNTVT
ncbi:hypothetical protein AVEN_21343-1 [Araneus ventricosus]|uniref:Uncharacterized protein n=1 Tax=Araneus ventricosus TaxID=182803 RepID=A0A4Y2R8K0_ARAVE|nr:hypothetical protein AVEN_27297-1 [Araneus ventricosus]GBN72087.1 hypothetical protein AVEN_21343-1 [Araneus ventricosus]